MMFRLLSSGFRLSKAEETALHPVPGGAARRVIYSAERRTGGKGAPALAAALRLRSIRAAANIGTLPGCAPRDKRTDLSEVWLL
jgi:hypothetical protein